MFKPNTVLFFAEKLHFFSAKNRNSFDFMRTLSLNESLTNDFLKLTML